MRALNADFGGVLNASDLNAISTQVMQANLAAGKGIVSGLVPSIGTGLNVAVTAGEFIAQVRDTVTTGFDFAVPASSSGYLWIQGNDGAEPDPLIQATTADPGSTYVCLGYFASDGSAVTSVTSAGRQAFGSASFQNSVGDLATFDPLAGSFDLGGTVKAASLGLVTKAVAGSNITLTAEESRALSLVLTGTPGAGRNVVVETVAGSPFAVVNQTDSTMTIKTASGTGVAIATNKAALVLCDGTNVVRITADA